MLSHESNLEAHKIKNINYILFNIVVLLEIYEDIYIHRPKIEI